MSTRNKFGSYQKINDLRLALPKHQRRRLIGFRNANNESITVSQEGSGSRDPMRDTHMKMTTSNLFQKGKVNWMNFDVSASHDGGISPRGHIPKSQSVTKKLRQSLNRKLEKLEKSKKLEKLDMMNPLEAYNTIDGTI